MRFLFQASMAPPNAHRRSGSGCVAAMESLSQRWKSAGSPQRQMLAPTTDAWARDKRVDRRCELDRALLAEGEIF